MKGDNNVSPYYHLTLLKSFTNLSTEMIKFLIEIFSEIKQIFLDYNYPVI